MVRPVPDHAEPRIRLINVYPKADYAERRASLPVQIPNLGDCDVVSSLSLERTREELQVLRGTFGSPSRMALAAVALGACLLAGKSLQPVVAISETARRISSKDLSQRVTVVNPDDELGRLAVTFNDLLARLEKPFALQKQFMADCSHELRTPVYVASTCAPGDSRAGLVQ